MIEQKERARASGRFYYELSDANWTIVGKEKEHWLDPNLQFCSCAGFYFGMLKSKKPCYHIESIKMAKENTQYENIEFSDEEFQRFISGLVNDL